MLKRDSCWQANSYGDGVVAGKPMRLNTAEGKSGADSSANAVIKTCRALDQERGQRCKRAEKAVFRFRTLLVYKAPFKNKSIAVATSLVSAPMYRFAGNLKG